MTQLPTSQPEGTPVAPDIPRLLLPTVRALAPGWAHRIVWSAGRDWIREPLGDRRQLAVLEVAGQKPSKRTTRDVQILVRSVSLRCRHDDGTAAYAYWTRPLDGTTWTLQECAVREHLDAAPQVLTWHDFRAGLVWTPDELEAAA